MSLLFGVAIAGFVILYLKLKDIEVGIKGDPQNKGVSQKVISEINSLSDDLYDIKKYLKLSFQVKTNRQQRSEVSQYVRNALGQGKSSDEIVEALKKANEESLLVNDDDLDFIDIDVRGVGLLDMDYWKNFIQDQQKWAAEHQLSFHGIQKNKLNIQEFLESISDDLYDLKKHLKIDVEIKTRRQQLKEVTKIVMAKRDRGVLAEKILDNLRKANQKSSIVDGEGNYIDVNVDTVGPININYFKKFIENWDDVNQKIKKNADDVSKDSDA